MVKARSKSLAFAAAIAALGLGWLLVSQRDATRTDVWFPVPPEEGLKMIARPSLKAGRELLPAGRVTIADERWTVTFDLTSAGKKGERNEAVEPPVIVILERGPRTWEQTIAQRNEEGLFEMKLEISHEDLRSSTVFCALDRVAAKARAGTALRLDRLSDRTRLGRCYASDGLWDLDGKTLGLGVVLAQEPALAGSLSLGGAEFAELSVTVGFHEATLPLLQSAGLIDDPMPSAPGRMEDEAPMFGQAQFPINGAKDPVPFGTFRQARSWTIAASSPDLELFSRRQRAQDTHEGGSSDWKLRQLFGRNIALPVSSVLAIDLWIDLKSLPSAHVIAFLAQGVPAPGILSSADLRRRVDDFSINSMKVSERAARWPSTIPLGNVRLDGADGYSVEVWSRPDAGNAATLLHSEDLGNRKGHRKLVLR